MVAVIIEFKEMLHSNIQQLSLQIGEKESNRLDFPVLHRVIERLANFSHSNCEQCSGYLHELEMIIMGLQQLQQQHLTEKLYKSNVGKDLAKKLGEIKTHLQKEHGLIPESYYMSIYMSLGMSVGLLFGLLLFDNIALGLPLGMVFGMAIGTGIDSDAKKKGKVI